MIMGVVDELLAERARQNKPGPAAIPVPVLHQHAKHRAKSRFGRAIRSYRAGVALLCTELFGMVIETWWLRRRSRYRTPVMLLLRATLPTATNFAVARQVSGHHVVVIVTAVAYL